MTKLLVPSVYFQYIYIYIYMYTYIQYTVYPKDMSDIPSSIIQISDCWLDNASYIPSSSH